MFIFEGFKNESHVEDFKNNIECHTYELKFFSSYFRTGFHSKITGNLIIIRDTSEISERGGPIYIHFYGIIFNLFKKNYLVGIFIPEIFYTVFTIVFSLFADEYMYFRVVILLLWLWIYLSNFRRIKKFLGTIEKWMENKSGDKDGQEDGSPVS